MISHLFSSERANKRTSEARGDYKFCAPRRFAPSGSFIAHFLTVPPTGCSKFPFS